MKNPTLKLHTTCASEMPLQKAGATFVPLVIIQMGSVQGRLDSVGSSSDIVPVKLEGATGEALLCEASALLGKELAKLQFKHLRVYGKCQWESRPKGGWQLRKMLIQSYEQLETSSLRSAIDQLKNLGGLRWNEDDWAEWNEPRE